MKLWKWFMWHLEHKHEYNAGYNWGMSRMFTNSGQDKRLIDYIDKQPDDYYMQGAARAVLDWRMEQEQN